MTARHLFFLMMMTLVLASCGTAKREKMDQARKNGGSFGKPGPYAGESCYIGEAQGAHACAEVAANDQTGEKILNTYCAQENGARTAGTCKVDGLVGTCRNIPGAVNIKMRYYNVSWAQAKIDCDRMQGYLDRFY